MNPTKRDWRRRKKPRRRRLRRRHRQLSADAPIAGKFVPTVGWSGRNAARQAGRPPFWRGDRRFDPRIDGHTFIVGSICQSESDHGFGITQGGAFSRGSAPNPPRLARKGMSDNRRLSDILTTFGIRGNFSRLSARQPSEASDFPGASAVMLPLKSAELEPALGGGRRCGQLKFGRNSRNLPRDRENFSWSTIVRLAEIGIDQT